MLDSGADKPPASDSEQGEGRDRSLCGPAGLSDLGLEGALRGYNTDDVDTLARLLTAPETLYQGIVQSRTCPRGLRPAGERIVVAGTDPAVRIVNILADTVKARAHRR